MSKAEQYFPTVNVETYKACVRARQKFLTYPSHWYELAENIEEKNYLALALDSNNTRMIQAVYEAKINHGALTEQDTLSILQWGFQQQNQDIVDFFLKLINVGENTFHLLVKVHDNSAMQNNADAIATLAARIHQKLRMLSLDGYQHGLPAEIVMEILQQFTPRQLVQFRRINNNFNQLINDAKFIFPLVNAYGLREEYDMECAKPGAAQLSNFAKFYKVYLRTWVKPDAPVLKESIITEELVRAMVLRQGDKVKALLATDNHGFVQTHAFPLRWAARAGRVEYALLLLRYEACTMPHQETQQAELKCNPKAAFLEAVRGNHRNCAELLFNSMTRDQLAALRAAVKIAVKNGYMALMLHLLAINNQYAVYNIIDKAIMAAARYGQIAIFHEVMANYCKEGVVELTTLVFALLVAVKKNNATMAAAILKIIQFEDRYLRPESPGGGYDKLIMLMMSLTLLFNRHARISPQRMFAVGSTSEFFAARNENDLMRQKFHSIISESLSTAWFEALHDEVDEIATLAKQTPPRVLFTQALFGLRVLPPTAVMIANITSQTWLNRSLPEQLSTDNKKDNFTEHLAGFFKESLWNLVTNPDAKLKVQLKEPEGIFLLKICSVLLQNEEDEANSVLRKLIINSEKIASRNKLLIIDVLKTAIKQLLTEKEIDLEVSVEIYLLVACMLDDRFTVAQKLTVIQAYQQTSKQAWQQTLAKSLIDKLNETAAACLDEGIGAAELLAAQGLFKTLEQQELSEAVEKKQAAQIESKKMCRS